MYLILLLLVLYMELRLLYGNKLVDIFYISYWLNEDSSWNFRCRGCHGLKSQITNLINSHKLDIFLILKMKDNSIKAQILLENYINYVEIPPERFSRGIWLLWKLFIDFYLQIT